MTIMAYFLRISVSCNERGLEESVLLFCMAYYDSDRVDNLPTVIQRDITSLQIKVKCD